MFSVLGGLIAVPAITATTEAIRQSQRQNAREQHRGRKSNLVVTLPYKSKWNAKFDGALIILKDNKLYIDTAANELGRRQAGHPFAGYYLPHPENQSRWKGAGWRGEGMVSTISDDPPFLNWIYVDRFTHEVKYGNKLEAVGHHLGPWDCTEIDHRVTFEGWEGFLAVQETEDDEDEDDDDEDDDDDDDDDEDDDDDKPKKSDLWALYFDKDDNFLTSNKSMVGNRGVGKLQILLTRRERPRTHAEEQADRAERVERAEAKARRDAQRAREKAMPVQEVFSKAADDESQQADYADVRIVHEEEIDE